MLRALSHLLRREIDPAQLALTLEQPPRDADELLGLLRRMGLTRIQRCTLTRNRNVMVSFRGVELRVHAGYLDAPREVHQAIVGFVEGRSRGVRAAARRRIIEFGIATPREPSRRERTRAIDEPLAARLTEMHARFNADHFNGELRAVPVRVSRRMRSRLGHYSAATANEPGEIAISFRHFRRHGWDEALHTLLHEMVHQWQDETGRPIDHGRDFRRKAREVGVTPAAKRVADERRRAGS
jgi:hypothetical protein